jgi:D-arabinose 5-phosphate isomerase GutQ
VTTAGDDDLVQAARNLLAGEAAAVASVSRLLDGHLVEAARLVATCPGRIFVTGAGTSGAMAYRLAHLLGTCGIPAFFIPPGDALHGESAIAAPGDILIALSKAGKSSDINEYASIVRGRGCMVMAWTANPGSELARLSDVVLVIEAVEAGEGEGVLPFGSTLAQGALGDVLCLMAKRLRNFDLAQLRQTHPLGGASALLAGPEDNEPGRS